MKKLLFVVCLLFVADAMFSQELNTSSAVDSTLRKVHWKRAKKVKLGEGRKDWYFKDKNSQSNYFFFIHHSEGMTEFTYYDDQLVRIKHTPWPLPEENKKGSIDVFYIYKGEVVDKKIYGREVSPTPLLQLGKERKEEAKKIIFQKP